MLSTTEAIVLALQPLSDRAHLLHAYTRTGGRVNFKVYGLGKHHSAGLYTPLSLIQISADIHGEKLPSLRTAQLIHVPITLTTDPRKQAIAIFLSEVLFLTLRHPMADEDMFSYIAETVKWLDWTDEPRNFHLQFLVGFAARLGFAIDETIYSDLLVSPTTRSARQQQLINLCAYFAEHIETWQTPKSLDVLKEVFD